MENDLRDEQTIIIYNAEAEVGDRYLYEGKVGDMSDVVRSLLDAASFYLLSDVEEYDVLAIL